MFRKMKNIDLAFRHIRVISLVLILACVVISGLVIHSSMKSIARTESRIYILANGKALEAYAAERKDNIPVEARDHVQTFHRLFFTLDPDDKVIKSNLTKALYLSDDSARRTYDNLKENGFYTGIISGNISQTIQIDSVVLDMDFYPYYFRCFSTQKIIRPASITTRILITEGELRNVSRSDNNPHGFLIEKWRTLENRDVKTENRI